MTGNPTGSMSVHDLQALLAQAMRSGRDPSQPVPDPRAMYGTTTYSNTPFQLGPHHPSHIPIRDTRPQPMMSYTSQLAFFKPTIRRKYETAFQMDRGYIRTQYAHFLETVEKGRFKLPAQLLHSCIPRLVG